MGESRVSDKLLARFRKLYTAVVSDTLDGLGVIDNVLDYRIRPLFPEAVMVGRARTALSVEVYEVPKEPYKKELELVDSLRRNDVLVVATNGNTRSSFWGELLSTSAIARGVAGGVVDGLTRDVEGIVKMRFPLFVMGISPTDSKGRSDVIAYDVPVRCGGVLVRTGDVIFGDYDGVVVVPANLAEEVVEKAEQKRGNEDKVREELRRGESVAKVFRKYGVL